MDADEIIGLSGIVVAVCALLFSITSFYMQQRRAERHEKASSRPILKIRTLGYQNKVGIKLINSGIGPAIIQKATFSRGETPTNNVVKQFSLPVVWDTYISIPDDTSLPANEELELILLTEDGLKRQGKTNEEVEELVRKFKEQKSGIHVHILYEDIFGNLQKPIDYKLK